MQKYFLWTAIRDSSIYTAWQQQGMKEGVGLKAVVHNWDETENRVAHIAPIKRTKPTKDSHWIRATNSR